MAKRVCAGCQQHLDRSCFTEREWEDHHSRCCVCIDNGDPILNHQGGGGGGDERISARCNESSFASFTQEELSFPFSQGAFRWAAKGIYTDGIRKGQHCVCKWFKDGHTAQDEFYDLDIKAMYKALELVDMWNKQQFIDQVIKVNIPEVWVFGAGDEWAGLKALQEPFIEGYQKFNSNTGWNLNHNVSAWSDVLQALSHFTYHISQGRYLLCDLQGGIYNNSVILTDPVILSREKVFGKTDLGLKGISTFFSNHRCNAYCQHHWLVPEDRNRYHEMRMGTSMAGVTNSNYGVLRQNRLPLPNDNSYNHMRNHFAAPDLHRHQFQQPQRVSAVNERNYHW